MQGRSITSGVEPKSLAIFYAHRISHEVSRRENEQVLIILGTKVRFSIWVVAGIEITVTGDELITLRSRQSVGALPRLNVEAIPLIGKEAVVEAVELLSAEIYRAGPESVVDCAREAATAILSTYLQDCAGLEPGLDLGRLTEEIEKLTAERRKRIVFNAAEVVRLFHPRRKNAEKEKLKFRRIHE